MQAEVNIDFDQFVQLAKKLPSTQWKKLKREVEEKEYNASDDLVSLLLSAPTFSKNCSDGRRAGSKNIIANRSSFFKSKRKRNNAGKRTKSFKGNDG
jgi:hypothetical protein